MSRTDSDTKMKGAKHRARLGFVLPMGRGSQPPYGIERRTVALQAILQNIGQKLRVVRFVPETDSSDLEYVHGASSLRDFSDGGRFPCDLGGVPGTQLQGAGSTFVPSASTLPQPALMGSISLQCSIFAVRMHVPSST